MHKHPLFWILGMVSWLITGLVSLHVGVEAIGYHLPLLGNLLMNHPSMVKPLHIIIGLAGLYSLLMMVSMLLGFKHSGCGCSNCGTSSSCNCK